MPSDETRRILKEFGIAVTEYEDALQKAAPTEELSKAETEMLSRLKEVTALIESLRAKKR